MKAVLIYPEFPDTFWGMKNALRFVSKKSSLPPLGLLTVAALLPPGWEVSLVDMNVSPLRLRDLAGADYAFIGAISVQRKSVGDVIERCRQAGVKVVAGGPLFTTGYGEFEGVDHFVLDEAESTLPRFLDDLRTGVPQHVYRFDRRADIARTPVPRWDLIDLRHYASMNIQYSRGCPFNCEFCDITLLFGSASRTKETSQVIAELEALYRRGWRGAVFFVDDNFIGNRGRLKREVLPAIARWMKDRRYPFMFNTQASINMADDPELMGMMSEAGFNTVFVGIETPCEESLAECDKVQNKRRDLLESVRRIQGAGFEVQGGFIVGFDNDPPNIFDKQIDFIQESGIVTAMVGLLNALKGTRLYERMREENRLVNADSGDNTDGTINFIPRMDRETLLDGYRRITSTIYDPRNYYERVKRHLERCRPARRRVFVFRFSYLAAFLKSLVLLGVAGKERVYYWRLLALALFRYPRLFSQAVTLSIYGYHCRKVTERWS